MDIVSSTSSSSSSSSDDDLDEIFNAGITFTPNSNVDIIWKKFNKLYIQPNFVGIAPKIQLFYLMHLYYKHAARNLTRWSLSGFSINDTYYPPNKWSTKDKLSVLTRLYVAVINRIKEVEKKLNVEHLRQTGQGALLHIMGFPNENALFRWIATNMPQHMSIHLWRAKFVSTESNKDYRIHIEVGHVVAVKNYRSSIVNDPHWYMKAFHHSNLGLQWSVINQRFMPDLAYPRKWTQTGYVDDDEYDTPHLKEIREALHRHEKQINRLLTILKKLHFGEDKVAESKRFRSMYETKWNLNGTPRL